MRLGFDAIRAFRNFTGLGNYSRFVLDALLKACPTAEFHLYTPQATRGGEVDFLHGDPRIRIHEAPGRGRIARDWHRTFRLGRQVATDGVELYHGLSHELPRDLQRAGVPGVVTMHDVLWRRLPETYPWVDRRLYDWKYGHSCRQADAVIAISRQTADDVQAAWGIPDDRIHVVYQGCHSQFRRSVEVTEAEAIRLRHGLPPAFLLQVGTIETRKNAHRTLEALAALPANRRLPLVLVGRPTSYLKQVRERARTLGVTDLLHVRDSVPFPDLPGLYAAARAVIYPSRFEGFGIPILEAVSVGVPVVTSTGSCFREAGGEAALYADPEDPEAIADALDRALWDESTRTALRSVGRQWQERFSPPRIAADLLAVYRHLGVAAG